MEKKSKCENRLGDIFSCSSMFFGYNTVFLMKTLLCEKVKTFFVYHENKYDFMEIYVKSKVANEKGSFLSMKFIFKYSITYLS